MSRHLGAFCDAVPGILGGAEAEPSAPWTAVTLTRCIEHFVSSAAFGEVEDQFQELISVKEDTQCIA
jgi:hypothetical protein